jgi:hypothetical protein
MQTRRLLLASLFALVQGGALAGTKPVEFQFVAPVSDAYPNPYSREIWAKVTMPSGQTLTLPAYYADMGLYAVRVRPDQVGAYRFGEVSETTMGVHATNLVVSLVTPAEVEVASRTRLPSVARNPREPRLFMRSDGHPYYPVGADLAWAPDDRADTVAYYLEAFPAYARANLNWMRVWMAHWDGLNLDWLPASMGPSPRPGMLSEDVAERWDRILGAAEENGVYVQVVLQHHGQYCTYNNANWARNPWNAANPGGFLKSPTDFFTDANANLITLLKYRYIVARWGWSPAVFAWELFNEVHWTNAMREGHEADVARWHGEMADYIRSIDAYGHLITTSTENLSSPVYAKMDYYQPHLYASNMVAGARAYAREYASLDKPVFYGEAGNDHEAVPAEAIKAGLDLAPPVWASIMGEGDLAAQLWDGWTLLGTNRTGELGSVMRFLVLNRVAAQRGLEPFSSVVECAGRVPLRIAAGEVWQRRAPLEARYPFDGREPIEAAEVAATLVGNRASVADGFPDRATYHLDVPRDTTMRVRISSVAEAGGGLRVSLDGSVVADHRWAGGGSAPDPAALEFPVAKGTHTLVLEDPGPDWIGVSEIDTGLDEPALALIGRRNNRFVEAWVWNRAGLYAIGTPAPAAGTALIENVPAGSWKVAWWDAAKGSPAEARVVKHPGGTLRLETPPIARYAAVALTLIP